MLLAILSFPGRHLGRGWGLPGDMTLDCPKPCLFGHALVVWTVFRCPDSAVITPDSVSTQYHPRTDGHVSTQILVSKCHFALKGSGSFDKLSDFRSGTEKVLCVWTICSCWKARHCCKTSGQAQLRHLQGPVPHEDAGAPGEEFPRRSAQPQQSMEPRRGLF